MRACSLISNSRLIRIAEPIVYGQPLAFAMKRLPSSIAAVAYALSFMLALGACTRSAAPSPAAVATEFVASINHGDVASLVAMCARTLNVRRQEWETARDGTGFVLGKPRDAYLTDPTQIRNFFSDPSNRVGVQGKTPDAATMTLLSVELRGQEDIWQKLSIQLFRRGIGDVEHIFAVGIDDKYKVAAIYMN